MITFLSSAKPFMGLNGENQVRALRSWKAAAPGAEVFLYGVTPGAEEVCRDLGLHYVPEVEANETGIPLFGAIVAHAAQNARYDNQVYLNCDILMNRTLPEAMSRIDLPRYLLIGQRVDLGEGVWVDPAGDGWAERLTQEAARGKASLHSPEGIDYFGFRRGQWEGLAPVVIGRANYDCALLAFCLRHRYPLVDATFSVATLHQWHDYSHIVGGDAANRKGQDAKRNRELHGLNHGLPNIGDSSYELRDGKLVPSHARGDWLRRLELSLRFHRDQPGAADAARILWRVLTKLRLHHPRSYALDQVLAAYRQMAAVPDTPGRASAPAGAQPA